MAEIFIPPPDRDDDSRNMNYTSSSIATAGRSTGSLYRSNTAAVRRDDTSYIYTASGLTGDSNGIVETIAGGELAAATQKILTINGNVISTVENTPLAATVVWDNSQINLYYFAQTTSGHPFLEEACQRGDDGWVQGALGEALRNEGVLPTLDSTVAAWTDKEEISVYFKSTTDGQREMTMAKYFPERGGWQIKKIIVNY